MCGADRQQPFSGKSGSTMTRAIPPRKRPNAATRSQQYLTATEVNELSEAAAKRGRHGWRDATMILVAYRHGLLVSELVACGGTRSI
jgi:type 1 fimbriae regulatory protein FimB/type 1 fimbriae regulatory protein FimE